MRALLIGLVAMSATTAWAQSLSEDRQSCMAAKLDAKIAGCTAAIVSAEETPANRAVAYSNRSAAYETKGWHDLAISDATQAIAINPRLADAYNDRAWAYHGKGLDAEALPDAEKAVSLAPGDADSLETRGEIYEKLGRPDSALADYRAALRFAPGLKEAQDGLKRLGATP